MNKEKLPDMYSKNIFEINYNKLKEKGITTLIFDMDNTIVEPKDIVITKKLKDHFNKIKKDFNCIVLSNTLKIHNLKKVCNELNLDYVFIALKPTTFGFYRTKRKYKFNINEVCMIGDQYFTDVRCAKKVGCLINLVDQVGEKEAFYTKLNRIRERKKYKKLNFKKGKYYE